MQLLHIIATPRGHASNTVRIANMFIEELYTQDKELSVNVLDLFRADLPAVAGSNIESKYKLMTGQQLDTSHLESWKQIEENIDEFLAADIYLLTVPMWNFSIPYVLKYYIDAIVQPGYLFQYNEYGVPEGLVKGKKMVCVTSRGGDYSPGTALTSLDFVEPYLRTIFNFIGITDIHFINAQPMDLTPELRQTAIQKAINEARVLASSEHWAHHIDHDIVEFPEGAKPKPLSEE